MSRKTATQDSTKASSESGTSKPASRRAPKHSQHVRDYETERKRQQRASGTPKARRRSAKAGVPDSQSQVAGMSGTAPEAPRAVPDTLSRDAMGVPDLPPAGPLTHALTGTITDGIALAGGAGIAFGNAAMLTATLEYLAPGWGFVSAASLVGGEALAGLLLEVNARAKGAIYALALAAVILFPVAEVMLSIIREAAVHTQAVLAAAHDTGPVTEKCEPKDPPANYGTQRLPIWLAAEKQRMDACTARQDAQREKQRGTLVKAADEHSMFEIPARSLIAVLMSVVVALAAMRLRPFVRSVLAILPGFLALFRCAPVAAQAPAGPGPGEVEGLPAAPPVPAGGWLERLAHWPVLRMLARRQVAGGAA